MFVALACLCLGLWATNHDFLGASNAINLTRQISMLGVFAIGISFVIITGGIDLSIGSVIGLTGVLIAKLSGEYYADNPSAGGLGYSLWVGIPVALGVSAPRKSWLVAHRPRHKQARATNMPSSRLIRPARGAARTGRS